MRTVIAGVVLALLAPPAAAAEGGADVLLTMSDRRITESSGLAVSTRDPSLLWTHNDSGDSSRIYAVGRDGRTRAVLRLDVADARDWEAMAPGPGRTLWVGDIGDNNRARDRGVLVHRLVEPASPRDATVKAISYRLRYPDGPRDAEALLVDPRSGQVYVVTKELLGGAVYAAPSALQPDRPNVLRRLADAPPVVTDGAFLPDGRVVLRSYSSAYVLRAVTSGVVERTVELPPAQQGESLAASRDPAVVFVGEEGSDSKVWQVDLGPLSGPAGASSSSPEPSGAAGPPARPATADGSNPVWLAGAAGAALLLLAGLSRAVRRRGRRTR